MNNANLHTYTRSMDRFTVISGENINLFSEFWKTDPDHTKTIIEILKIHKEKNIFIDYILENCKSITNVDDEMGHFVTSRCEDQVRLLSAFLQNTYYVFRTPFSSREFIHYIINYKSDLGYISDDFYKNLPKKSNDLLVLFTETLWKSEDYSFVRGLNECSIMVIAEYNSDRSLSFGIYEKIYPESYILAYFSQIRFWKTDYGRQLFEENISRGHITKNMIENIMSQPLYPADLNKQYPEIFSEKLINKLILGGNRDLAVLMTRYNPDFFIDSDGYLKSHYVGMFSGGKFSPGFKMRNEDIPKYVIYSIEFCEKNCCEIDYENMIEFLGRKRVTKYCSKNDTCIHKISIAMISNLSKTIRIDPEKFAILISNLGIDYKKIRESMRVLSEFFGISVDFAPWDKKILSIIG